MKDNNAWGRVNPIIQKDMVEIFEAKIQWEELKKKTILLTGAYGMLASYITYFIAYLNCVHSFNIRLIVLVKTEKKFWERFSFLQSEKYIQVIQSDLNTPISIKGELDYIIHAASLASPQYYGTVPVDVFQPNIIGNYHLLNLAKEKNISGYLFFSTGDIYGRVNSSYVDETTYGEMDTLEIHNCYGESKRMGETMCKAFQIQYNVPIKIARIWHTYSPTMDIDKDPRVFSTFVNNIINNTNIEMKSDGSGKRSFCYITDAVVAFFLILLNGNVGEAYNVCNSEQYVSIKDLAETLVKLRPDKQLKVVRKQREANEAYMENVLLLGKEQIPQNKKLKDLSWEAKVDIPTGFDRVLSFWGC